MLQSALALRKVLQVTKDGNAIMFLRYASLFESQPRVVRVPKQFRIGASSDNDIQLKGRFIDPCSVIIRKVASGWEILVHGANGCEVNGRTICSGDSIQVEEVASFSIFPYTFHFEQQRVSEQRKVPLISHQTHEVVRLIHVELLRQLDIESNATKAPSTFEDLLKVERLIEAVAKKVGLVDGAYRECQSYLSGECVRDELLKTILSGNEQRDSLRQPNTDFWMQLVSQLPEREADLQTLVNFCARAIFTGNEESISERIAAIEQNFWRAWQVVSRKLMEDSSLYLSMRQLKKQVKDILYGFGPLEDLLRMPTVSEIMVNASDEIFIEKGGVIQNSGRRFLSDEVTTAVIERIVATVGRRIDTAQPMVDARLRDGSRVNAVIRPLASKGPCITIRKFSGRRFSLDALVSAGTLSENVAEFLRGAVRAQKSILVSGGTGTGKTTLLNCLGLEIPQTERIVTVEDTRELQLHHPNVVNLEARDSNSEGTGKVSICDLVRNALRMRPDRIVVGECRSSEALDMLQAMNTGHDGSMTTIHANTPNDAMARLEVLVRESGLPADAIRKQIASAFHVVVQLERHHSGQRYITEVSEVQRKVDPHTGHVRVKPLFVRSSQADGFQLIPTGRLPSFAVDIIQQGYMNPQIFFQDLDAQPAASLTGDFA
jgi:Flp pilus assembly CpaF family ATPase